MREGEKRYSEWIALCTDAITEHRPSFALAFRQAQAINYASYRGMYVIVKNDEDKDVYVDMDKVRRYDDLIAQGDEGARRHHQGWVTGRSDWSALQAPVSASVAASTGWMGFTTAPDD